MRILVIEDEARILAFLARALEAEGYAVAAAPDGREGLRLALAGAWDLVILSARGDLKTKLLGFDLGASDYVPKPFALDELLARVRAQLRRGAVADDGNLLRAGTLVLDLARRQARLGEAVASLSDREFRLLHHLALHAGEVVSRERLLADVWGYDFDPGSNVVEVCVRRLRQKLGSCAPIETVRNAGYRLVAV